MFRQPVLVYAAEGALLTTMRERAAGRGLPMMIYTEELFSTGNDDDNRAAVNAVAADDLNLVGVAAYGPRNAMTRSSRAPSCIPETQDRLVTHCSHPVALHGVHCREEPAAAACKNLPATGRATGPAGAARRRRFLHGSDVGKLQRSGYILRFIPALN